MTEVRFHGRGGQGAVTSAEIAAQAAIDEGLYAQAFPNFGPERRGAPVMAFLRVSPFPIKTRSRVYTPDVIVILDPTLLLSANPAAGLRSNGFVVINISKPLEEVRRQFPGFKVAAVDASRIAREEMGVPITNTTMLGSLVRATKLIRLESLATPIRERFGIMAQKNISAYTRAYNETVVME